MSGYKEATHCAYCGDPFDSEKVGKVRTRDHIIPRVLAPADRNSVVAACQSCNSMKGHMVPAALRAMADELRKRAEAFDRMADTTDRLIEERGLV